MSAGAPESAPQHQVLYRDTRDLTPFRGAVVRTPVRGLADGVGGLVSGVLAGRIRGAVAVEGPVPKLGRMPGKAAKAVHGAVFGSADPDRLIALARAFPGWAGLCYLMAGLLAYSHGGHLRASELLQRGLSTRNDDDANRFASACLSGVLTRVAVAERIEVPVLFSEEAVFLALSHSLRETGQTEAALAALAGLPPSLPLALARCALAAALGRDAEVAADTEGLLNGDDLSAALLLVRAPLAAQARGLRSGPVRAAGGPAAPEDRLFAAQRCPDGPGAAPAGQRTEVPEPAGVAAPEARGAGDREGHPQGRGNA
jgi:hypothetical protein